MRKSQVTDPIETGIDAKARVSTRAAKRKPKFPARADAEDRGRSSNRPARRRRASAPVSASASASSTGGAI